MDFPGSELAVSVGDPGTPTTSHPHEGDIATVVTASPDPDAIVVAPTVDPAVSVVIVTYGTTGPVLDTLNALVRHSDVPYEVIVVDNVPDDGRPASRAMLLARTRGVTLARPEWNLGFGGGNDLGVRLARADLVCFLNPDLIVVEGWLEPLIAALSDPSVGIAAPALLNPDGTVQEAGQLLYSNGWTGAIGGADVLTGDAQLFTRDADYASAACWLVRRDEHLARGGFDSRFHPAYFEDVDYALRVEAEGKVTRVVCDRPVIHLHGQGGAGKDAVLVQVSHRTFVSIWGERLMNQLPPVTDDESAIASRDRTCRRRIAYVVESVRTSRRRRRKAFDEARAVARSAPRDRVSYLTDDATGLDVGGARRDGLEVVVGDVERELAVRKSGITQVVESQRPWWRRALPLTKNLGSGRRM